MSVHNDRQPARVLIVDRSADSRNVLRTILERSGLEILEAPGARQGLELLRHHDPAVVVLDLEAYDADNAAVRTAYESESLHRHTELVILGNFRPSNHVDDPHRVPKPYHFGPLVRKIEQLVEYSRHQR